jgi:hypothetical protein
VVCGTRGVPGTVAPFRAWRGSRDLVAQSPKFHAPAVAPSRASAKKSLAHSIAEEMRSKLFFRYVSQSLPVNSEYCTAIQLTMIGNRKGLSRSVREDSTQLNVASPL